MASGGGEPVTMSLLGGLRIADAAAALDGRVLGHRAQLALARLAVDAGLRVPRAALADAVWGAARPASWRQSLRNAVLELRRALRSAGLGDSVELRTEDGGYVLQLPAGSTVDVRRLRDDAEDSARWLAAGEDSRASKIADSALAGPLEVLLPDGGEGFVEGLREEVARLRDDLELVAGQAALRLGDPGRAERLARRMVALAPLREESHRLLIRSLWAGGNRAQALVAYDACRRVLSHELGVMPAPATQRLFLEILAQESSARPDPPAASHWIPVAGRLLAMARQTPFAGRRALLGRLELRARLVKDAGAFVVCVGGEAGMGKTRLAAELAARCAALGIGVVYGRAEERVRLPYAMLIDALERALAGVDRSEFDARLADKSAVLGGLLPAARTGRAETAGGPDDAEGAGKSGGADDAAGAGGAELADGVTSTPDMVRRGLLSALGVLAGDGGALLVLDDAQWATRAELQMLRDLVADPEAARLLVLVLHRDGGDEAALPDLAEHPRVERHELEPLAVQDVLHLQRMAGASVDAGPGRPPHPHHSELAWQVWRASGGNPLLVTQLLDAGPGARASDAPTIGDLVHQRLRDLPDGALDVLRLAAMAGLEFDPELVCAAESGGRDRVRALLAAAHDARLLVELGDPGRAGAPGGAVEGTGSDGGAVDSAGSVGRAVEGAAPSGRWMAFRHGLVRDALLDGLDPAERARLHQRLGAGLEAGPAPGPARLVDLAYHVVGAAPLEDWHRVLRYGLAVTRQAYRSGVYEDVIALASRALDALDRAADPRPAARLELAVLLGGAQRALGDPRGHATLQRAFDEADARGDGALMADALLATATAGAVSEVMYLDDGQLAAYDRALAALSDRGRDRDRGRRARLLARLAGGHAWRHSQRLARTSADQALALARELGDRRTLASVLAGVRLSMYGSPDIAFLTQLDAELAGLCGRLADPVLAASNALWRYASAVQRGDGDRLEALLGQAGEHARGVSNANLHHALAYEHAALALLRGRVGEAEALVARAASVGLDGGVDPAVVESIRVAQMIPVRVEQQRLGELREQAAPLFESAGLAIWQAAMAEIDCARGDLAGVAERIDAALDEFQATGPTVVCSGAAIASLTPTVLLLGDAGRAARLREMIMPLSGQGAYVAAFVGPIDYYLGLLDRSLGDEAAARRRLGAAAAFSVRLGAPRWVARCEAAAARHRID